MFIKRTRNALSICRSCVLIVLHELLAVKWNILDNGLQSVISKKDAGKKRRIGKHKFVMVVFFSFMTHLKKRQETSVAMLYMLVREGFFGRLLYHISSRKLFSQDK